jgi:hypothetical protein
VDEEQVRDGAQAAPGVLVAVGDRLVGDVAAGEDERRAGVAGEQVVQRRVRQHHAELPVPRGDGGGHRRVRTARREDDRPLDRREQDLRFRETSTSARAAPNAPRRAGRTAVLAVLAGAEPGDRLFVGRRAGEGDNPPSPLTATMAPP